MSFSIEPKTLKKLIDFYHPNNKGEEMKFMLFLKGEEEMYMNLQTSPFQGISCNSIQERVSWFGANKVQNPFKLTLWHVLFKSLTQYTCMVWIFLFSLILFLLGLFFQYNSLKISYIEGLIGMVLYLLNTLLIFITEYGKWMDLKTIYEFKGQKNYSDVWRENKLEELDDEFVVVGDVVELQVGSVVPADGWIIEGQLKVQEHYSHSSIKASKTTMKGCVNYLDKGMIGKTKKFTSVNKLKQQTRNVQYSPVVLAGSTVIEGQGRMMVFCVGKYSRKGQFQLLLKNFNPYKQNSRLQQKMQEFTNQLFKYGFLGVILLILGLIVKEIIQNITDSSKKFSDLANVSQFQYISLALNLLLFLIPQGTLFGLGIGLLIHKKRNQYNHQIIIKQLSHCESMSYVQHICHQKQTEKSYFRIKQWWNSSGKVQIPDDQSAENPILKQSEEEEKLFKNIGKVDEIYLRYFRKVMNITSGIKDFKSQLSQKSLNYGSFRNLDECFLQYSRRKSYIKPDQKNEGEIIEEIPYDKVRKRTAVIANFPEGFGLKPPSISKMGNLSSQTQLKVPNRQRMGVTKKQKRKSRGSLRVDSQMQMDSMRNISGRVIIYVRGKPETVLQLCSYIMCKDTGKVTEIKEQKMNEIKNHIDSMVRRQLRAVVLAYKITDRNNNKSSATQLQDESGYVLLAILGINDTRSTEDFQLLTKIKQLGVSLMISSSNSMQLSVSAANEIGVIKADQSSILINGSDFMHIVGGIVCKQCKKPICSCQHSNQQHRIKNIDEFERILKHLDVMANAQALHKYSLVVGLNNKSISTALTGKKLIDIPSMLLSSVALYVANSSQKQGNQVTKMLQSAMSIQIPNNSVQTLFNLIKESRISNRFIRKFIRLITCSSLVSLIYLITSLALFKQDFGIKLIHVFWIQIFVMTLLATALSLDNQTEDNQAFPIMNEPLKAFSIKQTLINSDGWKQIVTFSLTQLILLFIITFLGPLFIPQKSDNFDSVILQNWSAKYSDSTKSTICSGLPFPLQGADWNYKTTFQTYGVFSRHQTFVFALYTTLQIVNYFNFRQFTMKQVNIFKNFKIISIGLVFLAFFMNIVVVELSGEYLGFYMNGLTFQQWTICLGISMFEWIVGILVRLFPDVKKQDDNYRIKWQNKAYNLAVKSVVPKGELSEFEVDQYFELKPEIFSSRKID